MRAQFGEHYQAVHENFLRYGADLTQLKDVSFVQGHKRSTTTAAVEQLLLQKNIPYSFPIRVSNFDLHIDFCRMGRYATVCSRSHLRRVIDQPTAELEVYGVRGSKNRLDVELIEHRDAQPLAYRTAFAQLLGRCVLDEDAAICSWLRDRAIVTPGE